MVEAIALIIATAVTRHTNVIERTDLFPIAGRSFLKLLGAELRDGLQRARREAHADVYRKSQTKWPGVRSTIAMAGKQAGKSKMKISGACRTLAHTCVLITYFAERSRN